MPTNWAAERAGAHRDLKADGFLASFEIATIVDRKVDSRTTVTAYALDLGLREKQMPDGRLEERQAFLVAALQADGETLLTLTPAQDRMIIDGEPVAIAKTGPLATGGVTYLYDVEISTARLGGR